MRVFRWGKSLAVRLPKQLVEALDIKEGDEIDVRPLEKGVIAVAVLSPIEAHLVALRKLRGTMPKSSSVSREEANER